MAQDTSSNPSAPVQLYPGLGLPKRITYSTDPPFCPIGAHGNCYQSSSELVSVRELAMMDVMEKLTDKVNWHQKVFDEEIVSKWRQEALAIPDEYFWDLAVSAKTQTWPDDDGPPVHEAYHFLDRRVENILDTVTFQACIEELRSKAKYFASTGIIPTLDASATVAKSDSLVPAELHESLQMAFDKLKTDHAACPDWHPNSNNMVQDLVHPSMYPLVYGRSRGFRAERVGVTDAIKHWAGKGDLIPKLEDDTAEAIRASSSRLTWGQVPPEFWSDTYQWLPANVALREDGTVNFTSYINNLHPTKYPAIYRTIEKLIETSIPMWDQCLRIYDPRNERSGAGRLDTRLGRIDEPGDEHPHNWIPDNVEACADVELDEDELEEQDLLDNEYWADRPEDLKQEMLRMKWEKVRKPKIPTVPFKEVDYAPKPGKRLAERFAASGLQIIVKMASIELTPEKPEFPVGGWHVEGQMNECICATALYYLDSDNITDANLSFRMHTPEDLEQQDEYYVQQDGYHWLEQIYGTELGGGGALCLQNYGSVQTRQGRLLAFPNVFQHRVSSFKLIDPTKPGHRRFVALWLVDPTKRIISTANIPPQQMSWYVDEVLGSDTPTRKDALENLPPDLIELLAQAGMSDVTTDRECYLPQELREFVRNYMDEEKSALPMTAQEANDHRVKLMKERSGFVKNVGNEQRQFRYNFCEH